MRNVLYSIAICVAIVAVAGGVCGGLLGLVGLFE